MQGKSLRAYLWPHEKVSSGEGPEHQVQNGQQKEGEIL